MGKMIKDAVSLLIITMVAGIFLGLVHEITLEPIAEQKRLTEQRSCQEVFADADSFEEKTEVLDACAAAMAAEGYTVQSITKVMTAKAASGETLGYVLSVVDPEGYGGNIGFMLGVRMDGTVNGISILSINETAGLGMNADKPEFKNQFADKKVENFVYTKTGAVKENEIDAISGATFTTNAVTNGVNAGLAAFRYLAGEEG
ncbi:MAG: RnfABCDGE type electron transport complex subunit G [Eubacteriales bacterium]|nr:RnfABCDGE type electron transport complex subunit G [Eubacteriales bacterium]